MKSAVDSIIESQDIVDYIGNVTRLKKSGNTYRGKCPLHNGNNDSALSVYPENNSFYCFSCGKHGNIIDFVASLENIDYLEAIEMLAKEANIDISLDKDYCRQKTLYEKNRDQANRYYKKQSVIIDHLIVKRGLSKDTADAFYLGYDDYNGKAITIPLHDRHGRIVGFCKRYLDKLPKYINSQNNELYDKSEYLFNHYRAKNMLQNFNRLYVVEGYFDCMSAHQQGLACVAYCGSELTKGQIQEIKEIIKHTPNVVIMYAPDNDDAGQSKISRVWEKFNEVAPKLDVRVVKIPEGQKDFNNVLVSGGQIAALEAEPIAMAAIKMQLRECIDQQQEYGIAAEALRLVNNPMIKSDIINYLATHWNKDVSDVKTLTNLSFTAEEVLNEFKDIDTCFGEYIDLINEGTSGIGFPSIDAAMKLRQSDVVFGAGYSGTYKTMVAVEVAIHNAIREKKNVLVFSLEMSAGSFYERLIARIMGKDIDELEKIIKSGEQAVILQKLKSKLQERIIVLDKSNLSIKDIEQRIIIANSKVWKEGKTDVVILDYFQYLRANGFDEQAVAAKYTKVIAKTHNLIFFILSQLNRTGENFAKPSIKMLKGTGDLEASGDYVCLCWKPDADPKLTAEQYLEVKDHIGVSIGKARRGAKATEFELIFDASVGAIKDLGVDEIVNAS